MQATPYQPPRGCMWPSLILGGLCLTVGGLSLLAVPRMWQRSQEEWKETVGVIIEPYVETGERYNRESFQRVGRTLHKTTHENPTYHVRLKYRYNIAEKEYDGEAPALRQPDDDEDPQQAQSILPAYPAGDKLAVFHHPTELNQSRLTIKEPAIEFGLDVFFAFAFLLCGIGFLAFGRWISRRTANNI